MKKKVFFDIHGTGKLTDKKYKVEGENLEDINGNIYTKSTNVEDYYFELVNKDGKKAKYEIYKKKQ